MTDIPTISTALAAERLGVSPVTIRGYIARGLLPVIKEGVYSRIDPRDLDKVRHLKPGWKKGRARKESKDA